MFDLDGKVVVVSGGAGLLGREFCRGIAAAGGIAVAADRDAEAAARAAGGIPAAGKGRADHIAMDISSRESLETAIREVEARHGRIHALVNSAYPRNKNYGRKFEDVAYADFNENVSVHLGGYFLASQVFALRFRELGAGRVINIASIYGVVAPRFEIYRDVPFTMPVEYACIKSALIHLNAYMAKYFRGTGVVFNCISPGGILDKQPEAFLEAYAGHASSKGMLDRGDLTGTLVYLLSEASRYVNGQNLVVDDGFTL